MRHRGLARAMWGKNAPSIGVQIPPSIMDALTKSPDLNSLDYNKMTYTEDDEKLEVSIDNNATSVSRGLLEKAERDASYRVEKRMQYMVKAILDKDKEI